MARVIWVLMMGWDDSTRNAQNHTKKLKTTKIFSAAAQNGGKKSEVKKKKKERSTSIASTKKLNLNTNVNKKKKGKKGNERKMPMQKMWQSQSPA